MDKNYILALLMSTIAGLSTVIGGFVTFFIKQNSLKFLSFGLGLSAGVMLFISLVDLYPESVESVKTQMGSNYVWLSVLLFGAGILIAVLIDYFIPDHIQNQMFVKQIGANENHVDSTDCEHNHNAEISIGKIKKAGIVTTIVVAIHNFPEGLATFFMTAENFMLGLGIVFAIAIHNIPEGIAVALPIYHSTGKKRYAMLYAALSGITEPIGALVGMMLFGLFLPHIFVGCLMSGVAGIMTYISFDTLLPLAKEYGNWHLSIVGIMSGIIFIWLSLILLG